MAAVGRVVGAAGRTGRRWWLGAATLFCLLPGGPALAHPHVFVENHVALRFDQRRLVGFAVEWRFDAVFTGTLLDSLALPRQQPWAGGTVADIQHQAFDNLANYDYFIHVRADRQAVPVTVIRDFAAALDGDRLVYRFTADLARPVDPAAEPVWAGFFDHSYYVDVGFPDAASIESGAAPAGCQIKLTVDTENPIYSGTVYPQTVRIECPKS